jgi:hypothetical protein
MGARRIVIYMPDPLVDALNRVTAASPQSRSELICAAVQRFLADGPGGAAVESASPDDAFFDRVACCSRETLPIRRSRSRDRKASSGSTERRQGLSVFSKR